MKVYIKNPRLAGEETTNSELYIETDTLPQNVTVKETARPGAIHADGSIAKAGELTEFTYALVDETVGWHSRTFCPKPARVQWVWEQNNIDTEVETALEQLNTMKEKLVAELNKAEREAQRQWAIDEGKRVAFYTYFSDHAVPAKSVRKGSVIVSLDARQWWVAQKEQNTVHIGRMLTNGKTLTKEAASETIPPQERVLVLTTKTKQEVEELVRAAGVQAEREFAEVAHER